MKRKLGQIIQLYITKIDTKIRERKDQIKCIKGGIVDDKFLNKTTNREVLLSSTLSYNYAKQLNMPIKESDLGENILVDFDVKELQIGDKLQLGEVILEIAMECPICNHLSSVNKKFPKLIKDDRGIFANVIQEGIIKKDDTIYKI